MKFYICEHCGNIIEYVKESGVPVMCCGQKITELVPGTSDGAHEKHVPVVTVDGDKVTVEVGSVEHPMVEAHYIQWIAIETTSGSQKVKLEYTDKPRAEFKLVGEFGWKPEDARGVLNLDLKTEFMMCCYAETWKFFLYRRCDKHSHPHIQKIARELEKDMEERGII